MAADLAIVIPAIQTGAGLSACLKALPRACGRLRSEIVIVLNGPAALEAVPADAGEGIRVLRERAYLGYARAVNWGVRESAAPVVVILNDDAAPAPGAMVVLWHALKHRPSIGIASAWLRRPGNGPRRTVTGPLSLARDVLGEGLYSLGRHETQTVRPTASQTVFYVPGVVGAAFACRRAQWDALGGLDEGFFFYSEDTDLCLRMAALGLRTALVTNAIVYHRGGESVARYPDAAGLQQIAARRRLHEKHGGRARRAAFDVGMCARSIVMAVFLAPFAVLALTGWKTPWRRFRHYARVAAWYLAGAPISGTLEGVLRA